MQYWVLLPLPGHGYFEPFRSHDLHNCSKVTFGVIGRSCRNGDNTSCLQRPSDQPYVALALTPIWYKKPGFGSSATGVAPMSRAGGVTPINYSMAGQCWGAVIATCRVLEW